MQRMDNATSTTFFHNKDIIEVTSNLIEKLKEAANQDPLKRARFNLHKSPHQDKLHEMVIVLHKDTYVRPHKHYQKTESFHIIEGSLIVVFFNDNGEIINKVKMSENGSKYPFMYRLSNELWHMVIPLTEFVIFHETTNGPFIKEETDFSVWAPDGKDLDKVLEFKHKIKNQVL